MRSIILLCALCASAAALQAQAANEIIVHDSLDTLYPHDASSIAPQPDKASIPDSVPPMPGAEQQRQMAFRAVGTAVAADLAQTGGLFIGGFVGGCAAYPFVDTRGEWGGFNVLPFALAGAVLGSYTGGAIVIHAINERHIASSPWNAVLGMTVHYAVGAGMMAMAKDVHTKNAIGTIAYFTAPITGMAFYYWLGKPKPHHRPIRSRPQ